MTIDNAIAKLISLLLKRFKLNCIAENLANPRNFTRLRKSNIHKLSGTSGP